MDLRQKSPNQSAKITTSFIVKRIICRISNPFQLYNDCYILKQTQFVYVVSYNCCLHQGSLYINIAYKTLSYMFYLLKNKINGLS